MYECVCGGGGGGEKLKVGGVRIAGWLTTFGESTNFLVH